MKRPPMTVVETVRFLKDAGGLMPETKRHNLSNSSVEIQKRVM